MEAEHGTGGPGGSPGEARKPDEQELRRLEPGGSRRRCGRRFYLRRAGAKIHIFLWGGTALPVACGDGSKNTRHGARGRRSQQPPCLGLRRLSPARGRILPALLCSSKNLRRHRHSRARDGIPWAGNLAARTRKRQNWSCLKALVPREGIRESFVFSLGGCGIVPCWGCPPGVAVPQGWLSHTARGAL